MMTSCMRCKIGCLQLGVSNRNEASLCSQQILRQRRQRSLHIVIACMARNTKKLGKACKKHCYSSLAEQYSKLYLQSKSEATATKQLGEQLQSNKGSQSSTCNGYKAVLYTATTQSGLQLQSKLKKTVPGIERRVHGIKTIWVTAAKAVHQKQRRSSQE